MKICITSSGDNLEALIDPRFGRCCYFIFWDDANNSFEAIVNPNIDAGSGAGIQSAQLVVANKASVVITGAVGPKAEQVLKAANLQIITGAEKSVKEAIEKYQEGGNNKADMASDNLQTIVTEEKNVSNQSCTQSGFDGDSGRMGSYGAPEMDKGNRRGFGHRESGFCICPKCGDKQLHQRGLPCRAVNCHKCGSAMMRE